MKTYYDLTREERKNYEKEFKKTPGGKEMNRTLLCIEIPTTLIIILEIVINCIGPKKIHNYDGISELLNILFWVGFIIEIFYTIYFKICFSSWLKNKHDIKRW